MEDSRENVKEILKKYSGIFHVFDGKKKVICNLTKHEIPYDRKALENYINGKKFQRLHSKMKKPTIFTENFEGKYKEFFIPSKKSKSRVYCTLTKKEVNNIPHELEKYTGGYKFKKAHYFYKQGKLELSKPDEESEEKEEEIEEKDADEEENDIPFYALSSDDENESNEVDDDHADVGDELIVSENDEPLVSSVEKVINNLPKEKIESTEEKKSINENKRKRKDIKHNKREHLHEKSSAQLVKKSKSKKQKM